jgi:UDP-glucose 4-epimerase
MTGTHRVGVTGAAGYIGSRVSRNLLDAGHDVVPVDNGFRAKVEGFDGADLLDVDVRDRDALAEAFDGVDAVFHLAAVSGVADCNDHSDLAFDVNVGGTENVAWLCRDRGTPLVFPCSVAVMGDPVEFPIDADHPRQPMNLYGRTKAMSEEDVHWLAEGAFPAVVFVKSNLYGHHELNGERVGKNTVINIFAEKALEGEPLTVHEPGTQARDFLHVKDAARAYERALEHLVDADDGAETVPLASGECTSIIEIAELVQRVVDEERGYRPDIEMVENPRGGEEAAEDDFSVDTTAARETLGFEPRHSVEATVREMVQE